MPKHRRKKNQRKNKGGSKKNDVGGGSNKGVKKEEQEQTPSGGAELGKAAANGEIATTGTSPEIETVDDIRSECTQTIEHRSPSAGRGGDESKIAHDKSDAGDNGKTFLESEQLQSNFANFSDTCGVTESLKSATENHNSKTGAHSSTERKAGEPSQPIIRELVEIRRNGDETEGKNQMHTSTTSASLSSSDSDTIKAEDSPEREVPNVVEFESHDMHDVTNENVPKNACVGENVREIEEDGGADVFRPVEESKSASSISSLEGFDEPSSSKKPVKHPIVQEVITTLYSYRVESPRPMQPKTTKSSVIKKSRSLDDDDLVIQEMSDNSSAGDLTDNQPLVSEAESEADSSEIVETNKADPRILSITTIPLDSPEAKNIQAQEFASSKKTDGTNEEEQDFKSRRAKKRNALEAHFMPQFLNPRYLDSIKEECSDISDAERKSNSGDLSQPDSPCRKKCDDDAIPESPTIAKANAVFPKSSLDFSHKHKPMSHLRAPKGDVIREEPQCVVVEAKIVEQESIEESCSAWTTKKVEESGAAEIVYLDSASSSSSDLMDLDYTQGNDADIEDLTEETDVHIQTPTIEVDGEGIFSDSSAHISEEHQNRLPPEQREENLPTPPPVMTEIPQNREVIEKPPERCDHRPFYEQSASEGHVTPEHDSSGKNNKEDLVNHSSNLENSSSECTPAATAFKIGEPCSDTMFASLSSSLVSDKENVNKFDSVGNDAAGSGSNSDSIKELSRQDSSGSHGSGQSQSTVHSQCTAINKDSLSHSDVADIADIGSCVSGSFHEQTTIQSLRQLCIEVVASMPYGKVVLEELASVAQSLSHLTEQHQEKKLSDKSVDMPYPLPDLPRIKDLEVPISESQPTKVKLVPVPPSKSDSPVPPPVPELPKESSWLGVPTKKDPNVLVCLSPSQRNYMKETNNFPERSADSLLDMHQKFVERRGYNELTTDQVNALQREKTEHVVPSAKQLRNSVTPPPIPPPPLSQAFTQNESAPATSGGDGDDRNNHRLLAIIRDSKQFSSENSSRKIEQETKPTPVSVSQAQCSDQETQTAKGETTTTPVTATTSSKENKLSGGSGQGKSSSMAQTKFDRENFFKTWSSDEPLQAEFKRFSNIETTPKFCGQIMQTMPKRFSNIETSSYESRKRVENGQIVYDYCNSSQEKFSDYDEKKGGLANGKSEIMSDAKLEGGISSTVAPPSRSSGSSQDGKNSKFCNEKKSSTTGDFSYDEFRQRAKETAKNAKNEFFKREHLLKDFEDIEKILTDDMFTVDKGEIRHESKADMWDELEKKILQENQKEIKSEKKHYENWDFTNKSKAANDLGKSNKVFQQEHKEHKKETRSYEIPIRIETKKADAFEELDRKMRQTERQHSFEIPSQNKITTDPWDRFDKLKRQYSLQNDQQAKTREIPIKVEGKFDPWQEFEMKLKEQNTEQKSEQKSKQKVINIPVKVEKTSQSTQPPKSHEKIIPIKVEERQRPASAIHFDQYSSSANSSFLQEHKLTEKRLSSHNLDEWMKYADLGASSDNITKPFMKEMEIVYHGKRSNIRAPRLTASTNNLHFVGASPKSPQSPQSPPRRPRYMSHNSLIDQTPITQYVTPHYVRQCSLPRDLHSNQAEYIKQKEQELQAEFDRLEHDRRKLIEEMGRMHTSHKLRKDLYQHRSCRLPTLSEEEAFRQQMHDEWMSKVAEREERRLHKIIKISKPNDELAPSVPEKPVRKSSSSLDISDEFLKRVRERRSKLQMPSDSDWESGAESQPTPRAAEPEAKPSVKVIEGQQEADLKRLPKHLREFAELASKMQEERSEESSTVYKKSTVSKKEGRYPYKSNGYMSEPEPNYDSDYSSMKYSTLDRRRTPSTGTFHDERNYGTMPNPVKGGSGSYKNQPGRIENYVPGRSSVSEKEKKEWWDEVMDIFNGHLEQQKLSSNYTEGYLSRALKEQGYESDSNLVFRKKEESQFAQLSPVEQKQAYRSVQAGGEPPLQGFRKPAPEKPKENDVVPPSPPTKGVPYYENGRSQESPHRYFETDVNIHYKTPIRYEYKEAIPEEELARKQAETMKKLYQEERRRKYLQELQDMNSRRHTDNFTPSQKSPIPLNRYDDFNANVSPKSPGSVTTYPRTVARALYNFQGQTARELTFKKGDVIYIRRQIDKNWYEGEHNAMIGLLPANYVEIISKDGVRQPPKKPSEGQARAKFNFQAQSAIELSLNKGELVTLTRRVDENWFEGKIANRKGIFPVSYVEVLTDIGAEDYSPTHIKPVGAPASHSLITYPNTQSHDTLRTNLNNEFNSLISGGQPANGVLRETKTTQKTEVLHVDTNSEPIAYRALYKYRPQNNDELELQEGDIVYVLEKCDDGWYVGTSQRTGYFGTFPGNYVERV